MKTFEEWCEVLRKESLYNLEYMLELGFPKANLASSGPQYGLALHAVRDEKRAAGEVPERYKPSCILPPVEEVTVEMVKCGGKGQMMRVVTPA